jgi:hypothetical protein
MAAAAGGSNRTGQPELHEPRQHVRNLIEKRYGNVYERMEISKSTVQRPLRRSNLRKSTGRVSTHPRPEKLFHALHGRAECSQYGPGEMAAWPA